MPGSQTTYHGFKLTVGDHPDSPERKRGWSARIESATMDDLLGPWESRAEAERLAILQVRKELARRGELAIDLPQWLRSD